MKDDKLIRAAARVYVYPAASTLLFYALFVLLVVIPVLCAAILGKL